MDGNVIGINSRIGPQTAMNFHVAIDVYREHWETMKSGEDVKEHSGRSWGSRGQRSRRGSRSPRCSGTRQRTRRTEGG